MAKKPWVNINGAWHAVKNVWVNIGGTWKQKVIPKGNIAGVWKDFIQYSFDIYKLGVENIPIVLNTQYGNCYLIKNATDIYLSVAKSYSGSYGSMTAVTDTPIDLTNYSTLFLTLEGVQTFTSQAQRDVFLRVGTDKSNTGYVAQRRITNADANTTISLDVSTLSGEYYVKFYLYTVDMSDTHIYFNHLWLE